MISLFERITRLNMREKINAPMFAWSVYHNDTPPFISGRSNHQQKNWNGITVDKVIPDKSLDELNSIEGIEGRASCQGTLTKQNNELEVPTYFIFRPVNQNKSYLNSLIKHINNNIGFKSNYMMGNMGQIRVCVVGDISYETDPYKFRHWWETLPRILRESV